MGSSTALPGIRFVAVPPEPSETLPRMDVAGFVGFAAAGPVHVPVPIEDPARLREVFGPDLPLAWDGERGQLAQAHLASAVRAFFRNGGRRCWVVRVTGADTTTQVLPIPGLVAIDTLGHAKPALVAARSAGSWGDRLQVGALPRREPLELVATDGPRLGLRVPPGERLQAGDLIQADDADGATTGFLPLTATTGPDSDGLFWAEIDAGIWTEAIAPLPTLAWIELLDGTGAPVRLAPIPDPGASPPHELKGWSLLLEPDDALPAPQPGMILAAEADGGRQLLLGITDVTTSADDGSPPLRHLRLAGEQAWTIAAPPPGGAAAAERLTRVTLGLDVQRDPGERWILAGLGLATAHPRPYWHLPDDQSLYPHPDSDVPRRLSADQAALYAAVDHPRFPLAGRGPAEVALPLAVLDPALGGPRGTALGETEPRSALLRDGLAGFAAESFLDPRIGTRGHAALPAEAYHWRYEQRTPLQGLHALYFVSEVTLLATPDAVHSGWEQDPDADAVPEPLAPPILEPPIATADGEAASVTWTTPDPSDGFELEQADEPTFAHRVARVSVLDSSYTLDFAGRCRARRWLRVRRLRDGELSPWSNTVVLGLPEGTFVAADQKVPTPPVLEPVTLVPGSRYRLDWSAVPAAHDYELEEATVPDFADRLTLYLGPESRLEILRPIDRVRFFRVRALGDGWTGPWSSTHWVLPPPRTAWRMRTADAHAEAVTRRLHRAVLEMAAARRDLLAPLSLPRGYREPEVLAYKAALLTELASDHPGPSFAALYHPWLLRRDTDDEVRLMPPDGAVLGTMAARAIARGAWIAPANEPLAGVLGLAPALGETAWARLLGERINLVRDTARGALVLSAETLSREADTVPINVRRLLILLRRLALREGSRLVFEPNDASFRRRVQRQFQALMAYLFERGAFAGPNAADAYRVVTDASVNDRRAIEQGRFVVELRIAPSRPLTFLTVRLVQSSSGLAVEAA